MHWELAACDGRAHGLPLDERKRVGVAWILVDVTTGRVLRAGCERLPATGEADDYSTKAEGWAIAHALGDVLPGLPAGTEVSGHTDSACCVTGWKALSEGQMATRRALRKPDVQALRVALAHVGEAAGRGVTLTGLAWQPAEHNLPRGDDRRALVLARANRSVDAGAGVSAESGRDVELCFFATHEPLVHAPLAHYTHGGAAITGDVRTRAKQTSRGRFVDCLL